MAMKKSELKNYIKENILSTLSENEENKISPEDVKAQQSYNAELKKTVDLQKQLGEDEEADEKDAVKNAKAARGKFKKLDIAVKALKDITTSMKSLARKYSKADGVEKEKIKDDLKQKTSRKKELESLVAQLEKDAV
tara:strand:- start:134 stop:544 length:411 start_codon:yes stop_codon:yes gene_type:complete